MEPEQGAAQKRIYLWCFPRSLGTAFYRAMSSRDSCRCVMEPWLRAFYYSSERVIDDVKNECPDDSGSFSEVKARLEGAFSGYSEVFVKEHAYRMCRMLETGTLQDKLPAGYTHTFLIRHPKKYITSFYKLVKDGHAGDIDFSMREVTFEPCYRMYEYVTEKLGQKPVIIDADDIQRDPEGTLRLYCSAVGIDYQDSMLNWRPLSEEVRKGLEEWLPWTEVAIKSQGFLRKTPSEFPDVTELPEVVQKAIWDATPFYEKMHEQRLKP